MSDLKKTLYVEVSTIATERTKIIMIEDSNIIKVNTLLFVSILEIAQLIKERYIEQYGYKEEYIFVHKIGIGYALIDCLRDLNINVKSCHY